MKISHAIFSIIAGASIGSVIVLLIPWPKQPDFASPESAYQIGYQNGVHAGIFGCWTRTNKEVYYNNEIKWRAARFHNDFINLGSRDKTNGADFWRPVPVDTNYLEYRREEWPTNKERQP